MLIDSQKYFPTRKKICFLFFTICFCIPATAQYSRYIVQLTDKKSTPYTLDNPSAYLSAKSIQRRTKQNILPDSSDLPINPAYLDSIRSVPNVVILNYSKWLNQVLIKTTDPAALSKINSFTFIKQLAPVALSIKRRITDTIQTDKAIMLRRNESITGETKVNGISGISANHFNYAASYAQIHIHKGEYLHNLGFHGENIVIAILDGGFAGYLNNPVFDSLILNNQ